MNGSYIDSSDDMPFMLSARLSKQRSFFQQNFICLVLVAVAVGCSVLELVLALELLLLDSRRCLRRPEARWRSRKRFVISLSNPPSK
jgi:hypothetical protein